MTETVASLKAALSYANSVNRQLSETLAQLEHEANHDALTGLMNRRALFDPRTRAELYAYVTVADLNGLKRVNDEQGHDMGDEVIKWSAVLLDHVAQISGGIAFRLGGDEFVILSQSHPGRALAHAETSGLEASYGTVPSTTVDLQPRGIADSLKDADVAMYADKHSRKAERANASPTAKAAGPSCR